MVYTIDSRKPIDWTATGKKKICENVKNIINTIKYEAPYNRKMGIGDDIIDQPAPIAKQRFAMQAAEQIKLHEPRAKVQKITAEINAQGDMEAKVVIEID